MKSKKGVMLSTGAIIAFILLAASAVIIIAAVKYSAEKVDEELKVDWCRISNSFLYRAYGTGSTVLTSDGSAASRACSTIDRTQPGKQIPSEKYKNNAVPGAQHDVRDMVKDCWYMWLEGFQFDMFQQYPAYKGCFTCYLFKLDEKALPFTSSMVSESMQEAYFASIPKNACDGNSGGVWKQQCDKDERSIKNDPSKGKCCLKTGAKRECENKGGICSTGTVKDRSIYNKWKCPQKQQSCYVKNDQHFTYIDYVRRFTEKGGEVRFVSSEDNSNDMKFEQGKTYAVSFVSPNKVYCWSRDSKKGCIASIGNGLYTYVSGATLAGAGYFTGAYKLALISPTTTTAAGVLGIYQYGEDFLKSFLDFLTDPLTEEVPNFIIVSEMEHAKQIGCGIDVGSQ